VIWFAVMVVWRLDWLTDPRMLDHSNRGWVVDLFEGLVELCIGDLAGRQGVSSSGLGIMVDDVRRTEQQGSTVEYRSYILAVGSEYGSGRERRRIGGLYR
jgi:hypothetical protein